jgi:phage replication O-like protein O
MHLTPKAICDIHMRDLNGAEFKVLSLIARKTIGADKEMEALGYTAICQFTGLTRATAIKAIRSLISKHLIGRSDRHHAHHCSRYTLTVGQPPKDTAGPPRKNNHVSADTITRNGAMPERRRRGKPGNINNTVRSMWIDSHDEYRRLWVASGLTKQEFIARYHTEIDVLMAEDGVECDVNPDCAVYSVDGG